MYPLMGNPPKKPHIVVYSGYVWVIVISQVTLLGVHPTPGRPVFHPLGPRTCPVKWPRLRATPSKRLHRRWDDGDFFFRGIFFRPLPNPYHPCFLPIYLHLVNFFMVHVGIYIYIHMYIIHAMGKGAIGKPWKYIWNSKITHFFWRGWGNDESQSWCKLMYINLWLYVLQGIVPRHDPPHVRVEDLEGSSSAWPGCWLITHHCHCQLKPSVCHCYWKGGAAPKYTQQKRS